MKNKTDLREDGTRYRQLRWHLDVTTVFSSWGVVEIHAMPPDVDTLPRFMVRCDDGLWRYAHRDGASIYCSAFPACDEPSGALAEAHYHLAKARNAEAQLKQHYEEAQFIAQKRLNEYNDEFKRQRAKETKLEP